MQRHAHALADDRMCLAGRIADAEQPVVSTQADPRIKRPGRQPGTCTRGGLQRPANAPAVAPEQRFDGVAGTQRGRRLSTGFETVASDTAGDGGQAAIRDDHAAIASGERQHGQETLVQRRIAEVGLEGEQVQGLGVQQDQVDRRPRRREPPGNAEQQVAIAGTDFEHLQRPRRRG
ncbi:MAG: hypothetical protein CAPSK01_003320 [Candidatus Accumulibacter vicinus]|uniref:Uncharacterized protein n=1 Tax=Candidatus Accumulibacter vicinus TaxID=2954382 RepID=A0A084XXK9_9PROT|nr:MAG: hypothetical protein CAPSK01_003320 [Candidatus Accumulibacter vicinus]